MSFPSAQPRLAEPSGCRRRRDIGIAAESPSRHAYLSVLEARRPANTPGTIYRRFFSIFNRDVTAEATRSSCCSALRPVNCSTDPSSIEINPRPQAPTCQNILTCPLFQLTSPLDWSPIRSRSTSSEGHRSRSSDVTRESE